MRIGIDARVLMDKNYSGISSYTANLLDAFLEKDTINSYNLFYNNFHQVSSLSRWQDRGCRVVRTKYPNKIFNYGLQNILARPKLDEVLGGVDIFFAPHLNFIKLSANTKFVLTVHDLSFLRHPEFFSTRKNFWHRALNIKNLINKADYIVAASYSTKNDLIDLLKVDAAKIELIYAGNSYQEEAKNRLAGLKIELTKESEDEAKVFFQQKKIHKPYILFLGNIEPRKNIGGLIEAYNILRLNDKCSENTQLVLAGGIGWKTKKIFQSWEQSPFKDDIKFLGYVSKAEKEILYRQAEMFIYPSFYEGFGFPPLEAASFALPVITSHVSSLGEVLSDAALLINPFNKTEIAEAMSLFLSDKELRAKFSARSLERAGKFSWEQTASQYLKLFEKIYASQK